MSKDRTLPSFQHQVSELLLRHRSFLDVVSKFQESNARVNRALMKSVTECGCIEVAASKQIYPNEGRIWAWKDALKTHMDGELCDHCQDVIKSEVGKNLFYLAALCNHLSIDLEDILNQEASNLSTLGIFHLR